MPCGWHVHRQIADAMLQRFARPDGRFVETQDQSDLLLSPPAEGDSVLPSGQSSSIVLLLELSIATGDTRYASAARRELTSLSAQIGGGSLQLGRSTGSAKPAAIDYCAAENGFVRYSQSNRVSVSEFRRSCKRHGASCAIQNRRRSDCDH